MRHVQAHRDRSTSWLLSVSGEEIAQSESQVPMPMAMPAERPGGCGGVIAHAVGAASLDPCPWPCPLALAPVEHRAVDTART
jgi:hypothetical protein